MIQTASNGATVGKNQVNSFYIHSGYASNPLNIDYSSAAVGLRGHCNDYNITTEDASAARGARGARPLDLKEVSGRSVLARQRAGF